MSSLIDVHITFLQQQTPCQGHGVFLIVSCQTAIIKLLKWLQVPPLLTSQQCCAAIKPIKGKSTWLLLIFDDFFLLSQLISAKCSGMGQCVCHCPALLCCFSFLARLGRWRSECWVPTELIVSQELSTSSDIPLIQIVCCSSRSSSRHRIRIPKCFTIIQ